MWSALLSLVLDIDVEEFQRAIPAKPDNVSFTKGVWSGEEGILAGVVAAQLSSRDVTKTEVGKISEP